MAPQEDRLGKSPYVNIPPNKKDEEEEEEGPQSNPIKKYKTLMGLEFETPLYYGNIIGIALLHLISLYFCFKFDYPRKIPEILWGLVVGGIGGFGVTAGAHRYWTHKCFKAKLPLKLILLACYSVAGQNTLREWVRDHRVHHKFSETDADPHNANRGFWFAHVGWLCMRKHPEVYRKGRTVDLSDITGDPLLEFHRRHWMWFKLLFCFLIPTAVLPLSCGRSWTSAFQVNLARYCLNLNFTWAVNSFAHIWGNKPYNRYIQPVENKLVSIVAMGEGWHNYHHSFPWDYRAAEIGAPFNVTTLWLNFFGKLGWAYDMKTTSAELVDKMADSKGDGTRITR
ncbi:acyl-CoA Delta-9 desaturase-like isoform X2 [Anthonomus grandis grandis]|nr:acyl-CoA Delta-9 desaturase-like isoform X2 [Anthonomus grandis grandis]